MRDGWKERTLGEVAKLQIGRTPSRREPRYWTQELEFPFCTIADMESKFIDPTREAVSRSAIEEGKAKLAERGTLLMSFKLTIGRVGFAARNLYPNEAIVMIRSDETDVLNEFLYLRLGSMDLRKDSGRAVKGSTLNSASLSSIAFAVPSLPEQKRIVDLISTVDSYIDALHQQLERAKQSRNAVLHELLTAGGDDWVETTIGQVAVFVRSRVTPERLSPDSAYVGLEHLDSNSSVISRFDSVSSVSSSLTPFEPKDVLFGRLRPYLHKVAFAQMRGFCSTEIFVLKANSEIIPEMLFLYCNLDSTIQACVMKSAGTRMPRASAKDLASIDIRVPPRFEQERIAETASAFDSVIGQLSHMLSRTVDLRSALLSNLLSGEHEIPASYDDVMGAA